MKKIVLSMIVLIAFVASGCNSVLKKIYGIRNPEFETHEDILEFQEKIGFGGIPYTGLKADAWQQNKRFHIPDVFVFNANGKYIPYKDPLKPNCNGTADLFLSELTPLKVYHFSEEYTLESFLSFLEGEACQPLVFNKNSNTDFYIFMSSAIFTGEKLMKSKSAVWLDSLKSNKQIRYQLLMVNQDLKGCWEGAHKNMFE